MDMMLAETRSWFDIFVLGGGGVGYMIILLSVGMVAMGVQFFIQIRRTTFNPPEVRQQIQAMFEAKQYREAIEASGKDPSLLGGLVHAAMSEAAKGYGAMERAMEETSEARVTKYLRNIEWLNLLGNIAPMMGLLGTVFGMILAFFQIVEKGGMPNPADLADAIGIALVTTLQGLCVAIPSMALYGFMRNRVDSLSAETMLSAEELIAAFRPGAKA